MKGNTRGASESSTMSDNTAEFIEIVKKYDVIYNTNNPDYKNVEVKLKVWQQIADEINLPIDASKRKWKNLRDSYTKYLRSFRTGSKTSKKYQYWAHADHMDFLKPFQGPGRSVCNTSSTKYPIEDSECDLGYQVLAKATPPYDDLKNQELSTSVATLASSASTTILSSAPSIPEYSASSSQRIILCQSPAAVVLPTPSLPTPSLPTLQLCPQSTTKSAIITPVPCSPLPTQILPLQHISNGISKPSSCDSSAGCFILEPPTLTSTSDLKNDNGACTSAYNNNQNSTGTIFTNVHRNAIPTTRTSAINPIYKNATSLTSTQPPIKKNKIGFDISSVIQANKHLDANTLFFLSLARTVRAMPTKFQSLARMRCMRIVSDIELELENTNADCESAAINNADKYYYLDSTPPLEEPNLVNTSLNEGSTEHFVYVMSPSKLENMIDISSGEES